MTDWERVDTDLRDAGYRNFEFDAGETVVPGLAGEWLVGRVARERWSEPADRALPWRLLDALPVVSSVPTDPAYAPDDLRAVAAAHELEVVVISCDDESVRVALCDPE